MLRVCAVEKVVDVDVHLLLYRLVHQKNSGCKYHCSRVFTSLERCQSKLMVCRVEK